MVLTIPSVAVSRAIRFQLLDRPYVVNGDISSAQIMIIARIWLQLENIPLRVFCVLTERK
jgi:hypothetical protein